MAAPISTCKMALGTRKPKRSSRKRTSSAMAKAANIGRVETKKPFTNGIRSARKTTHEYPTSVRPLTMQSAIIASIREPLIAA
ncbi:hypothetical protein D3C71_2051760 [compost metagenome]